MPILAAEPECYPLSLFDDSNNTAAKCPWWVVQTKPRQEKSLARRLQAVQVSHYLPSLERRRNYRGRVRTAHVPLFSGYLFLCADHQDRVAALASNRIVRCLRVPDQESFWHDLRQIHQLIASGLPITPEEKILVGTPVEVSSGPLAGLHGVVARAATGHRFYVAIDFIEKGASVLIDDYALTPLTPVMHKWPRASGTLN